MPLVLALEPDPRQAEVVARVVRQTVQAELIVVDSRDAAIAALDGRIPDVVLLTALLSPRDEDDLLTHLRGMPGTEHIQTHTIPQLATGTAPQEDETGGGLLGKLRKRKKKKDAERMAGCDPALFAAEVRSYLSRAEELKVQAASQIDEDETAIADRVMRGIVVEDVTPAQPAADMSSAWASPFEWRRSEPLRHNDEGMAVRKAPPEPESVSPVEGRHDAEADDALEAEKARADAELVVQQIQAEAALRAEAEADAESKSEQQRLEAEAAAERERLRVEAEAEARRERQRLEAEAAAERERRRLEAEAEARRERQRLEAEAAAERERLRLEAEAEAKRERERLEAEAVAERERLRLEAEAEARHERQRLEAEAAAERERLRVEAEAEARRERERLKAEAAAERERLRVEAEAEAKRERQRLETEAAAERERLRMEAEAQAKRERQRLEAEAAAERERLRVEAEAEAGRERERLRAEAAAEREHLRLEAEAETKRERERLDAEAAAEREHLRLEAEAEAKRERERFEAEAATDRERLRLEAEAKRERQRFDTEAAIAIERVRLEEEFAELAAVVDTAPNGGDTSSHSNELEVDLDAELASVAAEEDPFAAFREGHDDAVAGVLRHIPVSAWARREADLQQGPPIDGTDTDDLAKLMSRFMLPPEVSGVRYAEGCRIRRVRVPSLSIPPEAVQGPVILSRKALHQLRGA